MTSLRDLDFAEAAAWPLAIKALCHVLAGAVALLGGYALALSSQRAELAAAERREVALQRDRETKRAQIAALPAATERRDRAAAALADLLRRLPAQTELPELLDDISRAASASGLRLARLELAESRRAETHMELPIAIVAHGRYHQMGEFAAALAALPRLVTLHDFELAAGPREELALSVTAKTYRHLDASGAPP